MARLAHVVIPGSRNRPFTRFPLGLAALDFDTPNRQNELVCCLDCWVGP